MNNKKEIPAMLKIYRKIFIILLVMCRLFPHLADGAFEFKEAGVRGAALAGAYTAVADDVEAIWWNPAGLRFVKGIEVNTTYTNLYGLSDLSYLNFAFVLPTLTAGTWGFGYSSFGPEVYKETDLRLSFATELGGGIYLGTNLKSNVVEIKNGGSAGAFGVDIGVTANISEKLRMAVSAININGPTLGDTAEMLESRFLIGLQGKPYEGLSASLDLQKPVEKSLELRAGFEFVLNESFALRAGVQTVPSRFTFGFGYEWSIFSLNYAFLTHTVLASQHMFSLKMKFGEKEVRRRVQYERRPEREKKKFVGAVNINTADVNELSRLPGVGKLTAKKIIEYREQSGEFRSIKEIMNIFGFTKTRFDKIKDHITVGEVKEKPRRKKRDLERKKIQPKRVPLEEYEEPPEPEPQLEPEPELKPKPKVKPVPVKIEKQKININKASVGEIDRISGVSTLLARNIVRFRKTRGRFKNWNQLLRVPGMNRRILENMKKVGTLK